MTELGQGTTFKTIAGKTIKIGGKLGEGGQGAVYLVLYYGKGASGGAAKAFKWYSNEPVK